MQDIGHCQDGSDKEERRFRFTSRKIPETEIKIKRAGTKMEQKRTLEEVRKIFEEDRFATENGAVIEEIGTYYAKCSLKLEKKHRNAMGAVMGGTYFMLADFAFAVAANWQQMGTVSLRSDISFLGSARGEMLIAEACCIKNGRDIAFYRISVTDELGNLTAVVNTTGYKKL